MIEVEKIKAKQRLSLSKGRGIKGVPILAQVKERGRVRDRLAEKVGFKSGREAEKPIRIWAIKKPHRERLSKIKKILQKISQNTNGKLFK